MQNARKRLFAFAQQSRHNPWLDLLRVFRRLEARGEIRGGRFVAGHFGEQFALPEAVGRRLDFLMQEFNREANTLGSKSVDSRTTQAAVELKVLIEQLREQVQNLE